jgi:hypothetical protein
VQARNVLVDSTFKAKVSDFGFARAVKRNSDQEDEGSQIPVSVHLSLLGYMSVDSCVCVCVLEHLCVPVCMHL